MKIRDSTVTVLFYRDLCGSIPRTGRVRYGAEELAYERDEVVRNLLDAKLFHFDQAIREDVMDRGFVFLRGKVTARNEERSLAWTNEHFSFYDPALLPFDNVYFGFGNGAIAHFYNGWDRYQSFLLTRTGYVFAAYSSEDDGASNGRLLMMRHPEFGWLDYGIAVWMVASLYVLVHSHRAYTLETELSGSERFTYYREMRKLRLGFAPKPYYEVEVRESIYRKAEKIVCSGRPSTEWGFRWDVRGHKRVLLVARPRAPKDESDWKSRGWLTFDKNVPPEIADMFVDRFKRFPASEWIATKEVWVEDYVKGPEDAPYVPSLHTVRAR